MVNIRVCRYDSSLKDQLIGFLGFLKVNTSIEERKKLFEWTYENNPYTEKPFIYVALDGEHIIAHLGFVIEKFVHSNETFFIAIAVDGVVHPDYRRKGLFSKLLVFGTEDIRSNPEIRFILGLSPNEATTLGLLKSGFHPMEEKEYMYCFSPLNELKNITRNNNDREKNKVTIEIKGELKTREVSCFMQTLTDKNKISNVRGEEFYRWRFIESPYQHVYAYCEEGDEITAYLSLRKSNSIVRDYIVMEYGYEKPSHFRYLIGKASKKLYMPILIIPTLTRDQEELLNLQRSGFTYIDERWGKILQSFGMGIKKFPALIKPVSQDGKGNDYCMNGVDVKASKNWSFFYSDVW
jgi:hypothetical protein